MMNQHFSGIGQKKNYRHINFVGKKDNVNQTEKLCLAQIFSVSALNVVVKYLFVFLSPSLFGAIVPQN